MVAQPCTSGPEGHLYCTLGWAHPASDTCNLQALDGATGAMLWEDRVDGECLLDEYAWITNPTVDVDGNVYVGDSRVIASFSSDGEVRWISRVPEELESVRGYPNNPFGLTILPTGQLATATMGDGYVLVLDRDDGELLADPFLLPSDKQRSPAAAPPPDGFMDGLASAEAGATLWDVGLGNSGFQVDNNVSVDPYTGLLLITGGAPAPNPANDGALWAVHYDPDDGLSVQYHVAFPGPGGIATTPTVTADGGFVLIGDNQENFVVVDLPACAALPAGSECDAYASAPAGGKLGASVTVTPNNHVSIPSPPSVSCRMTSTVPADACG